MIGDWLALLPRLPISFEAALVISALLLSLSAALIALIRNRRSLTAEVGDSDDLGAIFEDPSSIMPHVIELRRRIINSLLAIFVTSALAAALNNQILILLAAPIGGLDQLQIIKVTEGVTVWFRISITVGIILASPFVIAQLWIFIAAGLKPSERRLFYWLFPAATLLFISGVAFTYLIMLPVAIPFLTTFLGVNAKPTIDDYIKFVTTILLWVGVSFEMPLIVFGLAKLKLVNARLLLRNWRIAVVLIAVLSAIITPTPDPINMGIVAAPLILLYILSIVLALFA